MFSPRTQSRIRTAGRSNLEPLESRTLLSITLLLPSLSSLPLTRTPNVAMPTRATAPAPTLQRGVTLNLIAGVAFTGQVAFFPSPVLDPPLAYSASIKWGDGTVTQATLQYGLQGATGGYEISGTHTYNKPGTFKITTTITSGPISTQPPSGLPTRRVATITSKAIVIPANSSGGITLNEVAGQNFTATVGSFSTIAPATGLKAVISWGDGTSSAGLLVSTGVTGIDGLNFDITGVHTYAKVGTFPIHIVIFKPSIGPMGGVVQSVVTTINSTAVVTAGTGTSLSGTISGTYVTPTINPDVGKTFNFTGSGNMGLLGAVTAVGQVSLPGSVASGQAMGSLTLTNAQGTLTLQLTGPTQPGFGSFPGTLNYVISGATGDYLGATGSGSVAVTLQPSATTTGANKFKFTIA